MTGSCSIPSIRHSCSSRDRRTRATPSPVVQADQTGAEEPSRRGPVRGVVARQAGGRTGLVHPRHRRHQIPVPGTQRHPPDRHRHNRTTGPRGHHPNHTAHQVPDV